jgi:hypothetical protein
MFHHGRVVMTVCLDGWDSHKMFTNSLAAPYWFQTFHSMWHQLRPFKSELHSVSDDIKTAAITDWYALRDASPGVIPQKTPRQAPHPLDPENHTGLCFLPVYPSNQQNN